MARRSTIEKLPEDVRRWLQRDFFPLHLQLYSKSGRRKAPIYWPLATASGSYTLWVYYPSLNNQTLFTAVNDFLDGPNGKLTQVSRESAELRIKGSGRSREEEKQYETLQTFEQELTDLRDTLENPRFREVVASLIEAIAGGQKLSQAMDCQSKVFDRVFVSLIRAGETSGRLPEVLQRLTESIKWEDELAAQTRRLTIYPAYDFTPYKF